VLSTPSAPAAPSQNSVSPKHLLPAKPSHWSIANVSQYIIECGFPDEAAKFSDQVRFYLIVYTSGAIFLLLYYVASIRDILNIIFHSNVKLYSKCVLKGTNRDYKSAC